MAGFERATGEAEASRRALAELVSAEIRRAGLPVVSEEDEGPGAEIEVDVGEDDAGGVYVTWRPLEELAGAAALSVQQGRPDDPSVRHAGVVKTALRDAVLAVLSSAGFEAERSVDDMRPLALRVISAPAGTAR